MASMKNAGVRVAPDAPGYGAARRIARYDRRCVNQPFAGTDRRQGARRLADRERARFQDLQAAVRELIGCANRQRDRRLLRAIEHPKRLHGLCPVCGHYGEDCTGEG